MFTNQISACLSPLAASPDSVGRAFVLYQEEFRRMADRELAADLAGKVGASDIVQDTFFAASRDLAAYRGESPQEFRGWLEGIFQNRVLYLRRFFRVSARRRVSREVPLGWPASGSPGASGGEIVGPSTASPLSRVVLAEQVEAVRAAVERLSEADRQIIHWHHQDKATFAVISGRLKITEDAARKRWARALIRLRNALETVDASR